MADVARAPSQFFVEVECRRCRQKGKLEWETSNGEPVLIAISNGFYERVSKKRVPFLIELVCGQCGSIQPKDVP